MTSRSLVDRFIKLIRGNSPAAIRAGCLSFFLLAGFAEAKDLDSIDSKHGVIHSTDGKLVAYATPEGTGTDANGKPYPYGTKIFVRRAGESGPGILLLGNDRWMAAQWSPKTYLLGVEDHTDGHISEVYVYRLEITPGERKPDSKLIFHSPDNGYDIKWFIEGWYKTGRVLRLRKEELFHQKSSSGEKDFSHNLGRVVSHRSFVIPGL